MNRQQHAGVKVTYIETQFVTSDAAGFKDLVQRLTGKSPTATGSGGAAAPAVPHRPRAAGAAAMATAAAGAAAAGRQGYDGYRPAAGEVLSYYPAVASRAPPCQEELMLGMDDFSDLFYAGAIDQRRHCLNGGYVDSPYY